MFICKLLPVTGTFCRPFSCPAEIFVCLWDWKWPADKLTHFQRRGCVLLQMSTDGFTTLTLSFCFRNFSTILIILTLSSQPKNDDFSASFFHYVSSTLQASEIKKVMQWNTTWLITSTWRHTFCIFLPSCLMVTSQYHIHSIAYAILHRYWYRCANLSV